MIDKEQIERVLSNTWIPPPKHIYILENAYITPHTANFMTKSIVVGMHPVSKDDIVLTVASDPENLIHESIHNMGVQNELLTRVLTRVVMFRNNFPRLFSKQVKYKEVKVNKDEVTDFIRSHYLRNVSGGDVKLIHLELEE